MQMLTDAGIRLNTEMKKRKQAEQSLRERLLFEELLSALSARFIYLPIERVDEEIHEAMTEVLEFFKVDRFVLLQTLPDKKSWKITHSVAVSGVPSVPVGSELPIAINPWAYEKLVLKREVLSFSKIEDLPVEAEVDKKTWVSWGMQSTLNISIMLGEPIAHILAIK